MATQVVSSGLKNTQFNVVRLKVDSLLPLLTPGVSVIVISWCERELQEVELLLIACSISPEIRAWITLSDAFSVR